ncbi:cytochrome P450 [Nocardia sp. NBC_00565]|uniref:cytochrome P450 n=1 Tax=Nocardia sp. NBC_00565 TaxID=2975993 RepID=UPI002E807E52|nr:hypothetical protein [Nocardia sp. NBC_00565]WUC07600.1 cytochrome P450 [Nocardia sp. NBC_00565]
MYQLIARPSRDTAHRLFTRLATEAPVHWDPYTKTWLIAERTAATEVLNNPVFSSRPDRLFHPDLNADNTVLAELLGRQLMFLDGPAHSGPQRAVGRVLSPRRVRRIADDIGTLTAQACHGLQDGGTLDIVGDVAVPVPLRVISRLLGLPPTDDRELLAMSQAYVRVITGIDRTTDDRTLATVGSFLDYALDIVRYKRRVPADDGISELIAHMDALDGLDDRDIAANLVMLISAGHQTTSGLIAGAVLNWFAAPREGHASARGESVDIETELAQVSPSQFIGRTATADHRIGDHHIAAGDSVLILLAAINWTADPDAPGVPRHMAFGSGPHRCPGASLARLEGQIVLDQLRRLHLVPRMNDVDWSANITLPCPVSLPVIAATPKGSHP